MAKIIRAIATTISAGALVVCMGMAVHHSDAAVSAFSGYASGIGWDGAPLPSPAA